MAWLVQPERQIAARVDDRGAVQFAFVLAGGKLLRRQHADGVLIHRLLDGSLRRAIDVAGKIDAPQLRGKQRVQWLDGKVNGRSSVVFKISGQCTLSILKNRIAATHYPSQLLSARLW